MPSKTKKTKKTDANEAQIKGLEAQIQRLNADIVSQLKQLQDYEQKLPAAEQREAGAPIDFTVEDSRHVDPHRASHDELIAHVLALQHVCASLQSDLSKVETENAQLVEVVKMTENAQLVEVVKKAEEEKVKLLETHVDMCMDMNEKTSRMFDAMELKHAAEKAMQAKDCTAELESQAKMHKDNSAKLLDRIKKLTMQVKDLQAGRDKQITSEVAIKDAFAQKMTKLWLLKVAWYGLHREAALDEDNRRWQRYVNVGRVLRRAFSAWVQDKLEFPWRSLASQQALHKSMTAMFFAWWHTAWRKAAMAKLSQQVLDKSTMAKFFEWWRTAWSQAQMDKVVAQAQMAKVVPVPV